MILPMIVWVFLRVDDLLVEPGFVWPTGACQARGVKLSRSQQDTREVKKYRDLYRTVGKCLRVKLSEAWVNREKRERWVE